MFTHSNNSKQIQTKKVRNRNEKGIEKEKINNILKCFLISDFKWISAKLACLFGTAITHKELLNVASIIYDTVPECPKITREAQRNIFVLMKWYFDNWKKIGNFVSNNITLRSADGNKISLKTQPK